MSVTSRKKGGRKKAASRPLLRPRAAERSTRASRDSCESTWVQPARESAEIKELLAVWFTEAPLLSGLRGGGCEREFVGGLPRRYALNYNI